MKNSVKVCLLASLLWITFSNINKLHAQSVVIGGLSENYAHKGGSRKPSYSHKISLDLKEVSLRQALRKFTQLSGYQVNFEDQLVEGITSVSYRANNELISGVLVNILKEYNLTYTISNDNQFVIIREEEKQQNTGDIVGKVIDARTGEALPGANIVVKGTDFGAATSTGGDFKIDKVPPGSYTVEVRFIGYRRVSKPVIVVVGQRVNIDFKLDEEVFKMSEVIVTANRDPRTMLRVAENVSVVSSREIEQLPVRTVSEALNYTPGVHMGPKGGTGQTVLPSIYGAPHRNVLVFVDGIPVNDQSEGFGDVAQIPSENVERIEIVKGAGSSQWGASIGGVINIITKSPQDQAQKIRGDLTLGYGRWSTQDYRLSLNGNINGFGYVLSGSRLASDDFSDASGKKLGKSDSDTYKGFAKIITPK